MRFEMQKVSEMEATTSSGRLTKPHCVSPAFQKGSSEAKSSINFHTLDAGLCESAC